LADRDWPVEIVTLSVVGPMPDNIKQQTVSSR